MLPDSCLVKLSGGWRRGFSLLELVFVLFVVAILAGLALPVVFAARQEAHRATCLSQLRQLGASFTLYLIDDGGIPVLPWALTQTGLFPERLWVCPLDPTGDFLGSSGFKRVRERYATAVLGFPVSDPYPRSYLWARFIWPEKDFWRRYQLSFGSSMGIAVCVLHGRRVSYDTVLGVSDYQGRVLRLRADGAVVTRHVIGEPCVPWKGSKKTATWFLPLFTDGPYLDTYWEPFLGCD